jgi:hypothetical protein
MRLLRSLRRYLVGLIQELSDEGAYARHLTRDRVPHSKKEWQRFHDCRLERKFRGGRCC